MLFIDRLEIKGISAEGLTINPGDCISLSGASGMGKSLFMKGIADLLLNRGRVTLEGRARSEMSAPDWRKRVTYVAAKPSWWEDRVIDHFTDNDWLEAVLPEFDLPAKALDWTVSRMSSGESQRLALLRALEGTEEGEVRYFLLDEPTSALDGSRQNRVEDVLNRFMKVGQIGVLFVSHDERQVERFGQKHWQVYDRRVREVAS
ncbi:ATP-binding cassette domain-containing protein [Terasakiella sp. A23]|uniref:ABC transporter ATP-binding protein n=1 Tax=Terasakiella sp. FCG-A23 TaxID=3080561 RepID=UPI0029548171|nr:ATP-binding cassette domain-containing protein [Terasakiella sp. A23]MDV7340633.1 ATP-binding cassette domain-containing protein [Terasakiella sp. A23]